MNTTKSTIIPDSLIYALRPSITKSVSIDDSILDSEYLIEKNPIRIEKIINNQTESTNTERLSDLFVYRDYWKIKNYLKSHPQLRNLLFETYHKLVSEFDSKSQFILELVTDIYETNFEQLFIRIVSEENIIENLEILDKFENEWWFERTAGLMNSPVITFE